MKMNFSSKRRWMIVDDNADLLAMMRTLVAACSGAEVEAFESPTAVLAAFATGEFEAVITDFDMPGMNGAEFCAAIQKISPAQKIFLVTGSGFFTGAAARRAGFAVNCTNLFRWRHCKTCSPMRASAKRKWPSPEKFHTPNNQNER